LPFPPPKSFFGSLRRSRAVANFGWLVADKGIKLLNGLLIGLLVARYLGVDRFGLLNYGLAVIALIVPFTELGMEQVLRRRLIKDPALTGDILAAVWWMRLVAGAVAYAAVCIYALLGADTQSSSLLLILGLVLFQSALVVPDSWLQASLKAKTAVVIGWVAMLFGAGLRLWLVWMNASLAWFAWAVVAEITLGAVLLWLSAFRRGLPTLRFAELSRTGRIMLRESWPLLLSGVAVTLYMKVDVVMLRLMSGETEAGVYAAAVRLSEVGYFIPMALASSMLPFLLKSREQGAEAYRSTIQRYYDLNAALGYAVAIPLALSASYLVNTLYGSAFSDAGRVLSCHAFAAVFVFSGVARSQYLTNEGWQRFGLFSTSLGAVVNVGLNWWLIPRMGALGAAWATVIAYGIAAWGSSWLFSSMRPNAFMQTRALLIPFTGWRYFFSR
jgi:O-antigen/teichoic acid export membrane protein